MPSILLYLEKCSISLSIVWIFYQVLLRRLTFYDMNRWYLLGYSILAFFIPLVNIASIVPENNSNPPLVLQLIPTIGNGQPAAIISDGQSQSRTLANYMLLLIAIGILVFFVRLLMRWASIRNIRRHATLIGQTSVKIYQVDESIIPFSFGNAIFINQHQHTEKEWEEIILHEYVHIRQRHTFDILLAEFICALNWFNPFAWLLRYSIRQNLEFIADQSVLANGIDKKNYQYHLLKVIGEPRYRMANNFNFSSLKKRIVMMNKIRTARLHVLKFLFILPLIGVLLLAFRDKYAGIFRPTGELFVNEVGIVADVVTHLPLAGASVLDLKSGLKTTTDAKGFYRLRIPVKGDSLQIKIQATLSGYNKQENDVLFISIDKTRGGIINLLLLGNTEKSPYMMVMPFFGRASDDPGYEEASAALSSTIQQSEGWTTFSKFQKMHAEVALFYSSEGNQRHVVILKNGDVEKYGFPGGPGLPEMEKKYGTLPEVMTTLSTTIGQTYLDRWNKIGAEAEQLFHSSNPVALHIIFPGDSRVIAVPKNGKPEVYDMMNADPKERPSFEKLYGALPSCVPQPTLFTHTGNLTAVREAKPVHDTTPANTAVQVTYNQVMKNALYVVNGASMQVDWNKDSIPNSDIMFLNVIKPGKGEEMYGKRAANGVIEITTKSYVQMFQQLKPIDPEHPTHDPLMLLDGQILSKEKLKAFNPADILSIDVLKDSTATSKYGDLAKYGVVLIHSKQP